MVTLWVAVGVHCCISSPQQPAQRFNTTQDGIKMCSTSSGYSCRMSTSTSRGWHKLLLYTSIKGITVGHRMHEVIQQTRRVLWKQLNTPRWQFEWKAGRCTVAWKSGVETLRGHAHTRFNSYCYTLRHSVYISKHRSAYFYKRLHNLPLTSY